MRHAASVRGETVVQVNGNGPFDLNRYPAHLGLGATTGIVAFFLFIVVISLGASGVSHAVTWPVIISRWFRRKRGLASTARMQSHELEAPVIDVSCGR